jgi:hypothetical protein
MDCRKILAGFIFIVLFIAGAGEGNANKYEYKGYEVNVYWKVRGKQLRVWGDIKKGSQCKQLNVYVHFRNNRYHSRAAIDTFVRKEHSPNRRSVFNGQSKIRDNSYKDGWFVDRLSVTCSNLNPIN